MLGTVLYAAQKPSFMTRCEEPTPVPATEEVEDPPTFEESTDEFEPLTKINFESVFKNDENKFIFMAYPSEMPVGYLNTINNHARKMKAGLRSSPYIINMESEGDQFINFLKKRDMRKELEQQLSENRFILNNKYDDVWFWDDSLVQYFQGELMEQVFNFYEGVRTLHDEHELMITMTENDHHFVTYAPDDSDETKKRLKNLRRFHTKNTDSFLKIKFWIVRDTNLAKKLGIYPNTNSENTELYHINQSGNGVKVDLDGKDIYLEYVTETSNLEKSTEIYVEIIQKVLNSPVIVDDFMSFAQLYSKYQSPTLVVYCPRDHPNFEQIKNDVFKVRQNLVLDLKKQSENINANPNRELKDNLLIIISKF